MGGAILDIMNIDDLFKLFCCKKKKRNWLLVGGEIRVKRGFFI